MGYRFQGLDFSQPLRSLKTAVPSPLAPYIGTGLSTGGGLQYATPGLYDIAGQQRVQDVRAQNQRLGTAAAQANIEGAQLTGRLPAVTSQQIAEALAPLEALAPPTVYASSPAWQDLDRQLRMQQVVQSAPAGSLAQAVLGAASEGPFASSGQGNSFQTSPGSLSMKVQGRDQPWLVPLMQTQSGNFPDPRDIERIFANAVGVKKGGIGPLGGILGLLSFAAPLLAPGLFAGTFGNILRGVGGARTLADLFQGRPEGGQSLTSGLLGLLGGGAGGKISPVPGMGASKSKVSSLSPGRQLPSGLGSWNV